MNITERSIGRVVVLDIEGRLDGKDGDALFERVSALAEKGRPNIVLNLANVRRVDSTGVGALVSCHKELAQRGGELKLLAVSKTLKELLDRTRLLPVFKTHETEIEAIASFTKAPP
ncbi:MAG TPA: STAS domain-containing protein [Candidatus Paceibacterota bacterium]|nr:STAS domain-containing protein [Candidatus Paceibacterota bacterium]